MITMKNSTNNQVGNESRKKPYKGTITVLTYNTECLFLNDKEYDGDGSQMTNPDTRMYWEENPSANSSVQEMIKFFEDKHKPYGDEIDIIYTKTVPFELKQEEAFLIAIYRKDSNPGDYLEGEYYSTQVFYSDSNWEAKVYQAKA